MQLPEQILTSRLRLQALRIEHAASFFALFHAEYPHLVASTGGSRKTMTLEDQESRIRELEAKREKGKHFSYCIFLQHGQGPDVLAGSIELQNVDARNLRGEFGYWLGKNFQGRGMMTESVSALEQACWDAGFHHLQIRCAAHNERSSAIPQRLGYTLDGRLREAWLYQKKWYDELVFTKIKGA